MNCNCGNKNAGNFPPSVFQVNSAECPVLFHKVVIPTNFGDETETPVLMGEHRNALVYYEVNGHTYLYSSDGVPTRLDRGGASVLYVEELPETNKAMQDTLYVSSRGELAVYKSGDKKILNEKPTYYTTLGSNTDGAMTQKAVTDALSALSEEVKNKLAEFKNGVVDKVMPEVNEKVSGMERFVTTKIEEMKRETSTLVNTTTNDVNLMKNSLNKHIEQADITKNDLLDKIRRNTDSINDTKNSLRNYALISDVDNRVMDAEARTNNKITQAETRVDNTIGQAKTELNGKITEANGKISALDTRLTKQASDNKADITQLKANLNTTNSALLTHKEQADKKFDDIKVEQSDQDTLISDILNAFSAESDKGTNLKLNTSATKVLGMTIYGNTEQTKTSGKNIIDYSAKNIGAWQCTAEGYGNGVKITAKAFSGVAYVAKTIPNSASFLGKTITVSAKTSGFVTQCAIYALGGTATYERLATLPATGGTYKLPDNFPADRDGFGVLFYVSQNSTSTVTDVQVELGNTATNYEPYTGGYNNLFDEFSNLPIQKNGISLTNQDGTLKLSGKPDADWVPLIFRDLNGLADKTTYTVAAYNQNTTQLFSEIMLYKKDGSGIDKITAKGQRIFTFTTDSTKYNRYAMKLGLGPVSEFSGPVTLYNNYALFVGNYNENNLPEYSPFNTPLASPRPQLPQAVKELSGGKVKVISKNLLKVKNLTSTQTQAVVVVNPDNSITVSDESKNNWGMNITNDEACPRIEAGTKVTMSIDRPLPYKLILSCWTNTGGPSFQFPLATINAGSTSVTNVAQYTALSGHLLFSLSEIGKQINATFKVQLEYGDTATPFVPYESSEFTIPSGLNIYKLTDTIYDEIKLENGVAKLIKRVEKLVLTGEENNFDLYRTTNSGTLGFRYYDSSRPFTQQQMISNIICSHFESIDENRVYQSIHNKTGVSIYNSFDTWPSYADKLCFWFTAPDALNLKITDVASFKNWLKSEQAKGTPVTIYYEMKTPTEEEITDLAVLAELKKLMEMRTYDGTTNISIVGTGLTPEIKVKYMRKIGE